MADKSMFSIEVETATFDHFKTSFDTYHAKLKETLDFWRQVSAEINSAANLLKGLNLKGGSNAGGGTPSTPTSISGMNITASGTVTFTATGTVNFAGGAGGGGGGTQPSKPPKFETPKTDKLLSGISDKFGALAQNLAGGNASGLLGMLRGMGPLGGIGATVGAVAASAGDVADLRRQSMQLGGEVTPSELRAARVAGTWMNAPEEVLGNIVTARRNITSDQRRAFQNLFGTQGSDVELHKDSGTAMFEGLEAAAKELMKMPEAVRDTQALNLKYAQTFGLGNLRMMEQMLSSPEGIKELEERRTSFKDFDKQTKMAPQEEKDATDFSTGWAQIWEMTKMLPFKMWEGFRRGIPELFDPEARKKIQEIYKDSEKNQPNLYGPDSLIQKLFGGGKKDTPSGPRAPTPEEQERIDRAKKIQDSVKKPSPESSAAPSPLSSYEAGSLGGMRGEIKTTDEEGTKVQKDQAETLKEIRDDLKRWGEGGEGGGRSGGGGGGGGGGSGAGGGPGRAAGGKPGYQPSGSGSEGDILAQIRQRESKGNYGLRPEDNYAYPKSHASGAYQIQPGTWKAWTQASGIGTQFAEAYLAPPEIQDQVAAWALRKYGANSTGTWAASAPPGGYPTIGGGGGGGGGGPLGMKGVDPRIADIVEHASKSLPPGYKIVPTSGKREQGYGFHPKGMAEDFQIIGPDGKPIANRGDDTTGLYTKLAKNAYGYQEKFHPELTGQFQWGGQFGTVPGGGTPDLMHFDIGGRRGTISRYSREAIGSELPPASDTPSPDASAVAASTSSQGGGFAIPGDTPLPPSRPHDLAAHADHHMRLAHHHHRRGNHRRARHHLHLALHHAMRHAKHFPMPPRRPADLGGGKSNYLALKSFLETHKVGTEEGDAPGGSQFKSLTDSVLREGGYDKHQFDIGDPHPWGYVHKKWREFPEDQNFQKWSDRPEFPASYRSSGKGSNAPQGAPGEQQAKLSTPLGLHNWQLAMNTGVNIHNKTGSDVFIAASTLAG